MSESLLSYFEQELAFIRQDAGNFAQRHPGAAKSLGISRDSIDDPQVTRLIDSVALLNARLQQRLDEDYPQLTDSLLQLLFPHYLRPVPAYSMVKMQPHEEVTAKYTLPRGTHLGLDDVDTDTLVFRTTQDVDLYPISLTDCSASIAPFDIQKPKGAEHAKAMLELTLTTTDPTILFSDLELTELSLFLRGETPTILRLYDHLFSGIQQIAIQYDDSVVLLGADALLPVGFEDQEFVLPYSVRSFGGFKLLTEFFMFAERFHAIKLVLSSALQHANTNTLKIQFFLDDMPVELARSLSVNNFNLFCSPIINLQPITAEPLRIDFSQSQYPIMLDVGGQAQLQLFSVDDVTDVTEQKNRNVPPLYGEKFNSAEIGLRWQLSQSENMSDKSVSSALRVANLDHSHVDKSAHTWLISTTCTNGNAASQLSTSCELHCHDSISLPADLTLLRRPTKQININTGEQGAWPLLAHLHFNYQALFGSDDPVSALKTMLQLYNHNNSAKNSAYIESIQGLSQAHVVAPVRISGKSCFANGTRLSVTINPMGLAGGVELLAQLLDRFFAYFSGFNSFTQVVILLDGREGEYRVFPRRLGCKNLY
ncbi:MULTISPECIES: type VI secretion system baseplate subunit TssF [unclassified Moritella]|uniref:type VI secretion system baseplate subunit TssF n=1 Tax=unclassified Moritella TaxID=2637987 RepID=UPI001BA5BE2D|nr:MULTISPECIES: type VI secretion system baseplate subunit TssF [unclassified Moritella]QUM79871.1 type VI secretion system baseplate subunit TssF [Moritella sp. 5]QUM84102.1 type VI secretion system baseplate subunit TssF [Moritella sp. 28]